MYAIIDIETTGGNPVHDKITEIAIFLHDGNQVTDEYTTLVNPERSIPYFITGITGITNEMVADAPKFYEVAKKIVELTENRTFVAHNAAFDYNFVRSEFNSFCFLTENLMIIDKGRNKEEHAVIKIEHGKYIGFGFMDADCMNGLESLNDCIKTYEDNRDTRQIIKSYLSSHKVDRIVRF